MQELSQEYQRLQDLWNQVYLQNDQIKDQWAGKNYTYFENEIQEPVRDLMEDVLAGLERFIDALTDAENVLNRR